jgi:leader peptidase (prepilin peptidase)/N-methyltransferase
MATWRLLLAVVLSIPAGWFAEVLIERGPTGRPLLRPLTLGGMSRRRGITQSLITLGFVLIAVRFEDSSLGLLIGMFALYAVLVALAIIDSATYRLPDRIVLPMLCLSIIWISAVALIDGSPEKIRFAICGALVYFVTLFVAHLISPRGMGFGDVKLAALLGLFLGASSSTLTDAVVLVLWAMVIGFAIGTVAGIVILVRRGSNHPFPFGPYLAAGTMIALLASPAILQG